MTRLAGRTPVAIALGSNMGDRRGHLDYAVSRLGRFLHDMRVSSYYETAPVDVVGEQWDFLNAAAVGETELTAREVLDALLAIEAARGRQRPHPSAPRTLDLDIVLFGDQVIDEPGLVVPHPQVSRAALRPGSAGRDCARTGAIRSPERRLPSSD